MLVAWRVKEWLEPLLYHTIGASEVHSIEGHPRFTEQILSTVLRSKPPAFFRNSVRHLLLHGFQEPFITLVLSICTGVENLRAFYASEPLVHLSTIPFPLKRLCTQFVPIFIQVPPTSPLFARLTHLELFEPPTDIVVCATLALLPRLTHLAFNDYLTEIPVSCYLSVLQNCKFLTVLISLRRPSHASYHESYEDDVSKDARFVVIVSHGSWFNDWQMEVLNGEGYWSQADAFIAKRRSGEIDAGEYRMNRDPIFK